MYKLTLTKEERNAFDLLGYRYPTAGDTSNVLTECLSPDQAWDDEGDVTFLIPEHLAWTIQELAEQDDMQFTCFDDVLKNKMLDFIDNIV